MNAVITGAADGQTVVVTIKPSEFLSGTIAASGTIEGRLLHLSGGGNGGNLNLNLLRSDEADFRAQVAALTEQARQIDNARLQQEAAQRKAKIEADQLANLQSLTQRMIVFTTKADAILPKFAPVEQRYHDITQRMRGALAREQSIYGGGQASVARGQISVAINQAAIQANQIHIGVGSSYQTFDSGSGQLSRNRRALARAAVAHMSPLTLHLFLSDMRLGTPHAYAFSMLPRITSSTSPICARRSRRRKPFGTPSGASRIRSSKHRTRLCSKTDEATDDENRRLDQFGSSACNCGDGRCYLLPCEDYLDCLPKIPPMPRSRPIGTIRKIGGRFA